MTRVADPNRPPLSGRGWWPWAGAVLAGLALSAALPPFGWWPLGLLGAALLAHLLEDRSVRGRAGVGLGTGIGFLAPGLFWMSEFSAPGYGLAVLIETALFTLGAVAAPPGRWRLVGLPAALVLAEALRGRWPFGGVPIATLAETQIGGPLAFVARLGGPLLVAAVVGLAGAALSAAGAGRRRGLVAGAVVALVAVLAAVAPHGEPAGALDAMLVQGGGDRGTRADDTPDDVVFRRHLEASAGIEPGHDLVLWPEDVVEVHGGDITVSEEGEALSALARSLETTLVAGVVTTVGDHFVNESVAWGPDGRIVGRYVKNQRVPFGEYIPLRSLVERLADVSAVPRDATVGTGPGLLAGRLGVVISYEVFFPRRARDALQSGAEVLLVPTNASSFSTTQMPALELGAARMRAIESGRWVLQAAPTGFSALIDPAGHVREVSRLGAEAVLPAPAELRTGRTPYTALGDGPVVAGAALALALAWTLGRRRDRSDPNFVEPATPDVAHSTKFGGGGS